MMRTFFWFTTRAILGGTRVRFNSVWRRAFAEFRDVLITYSFTHGLRLKADSTVGISAPAVGNGRFRGT
mgnify:CR=1